MTSLQSRESSTVSASYRQEHKWHPTKKQIEVQQKLRSGQQTPRVPRLLEARPTSRRKGWRRNTRLERLSRNEEATPRPGRPAVRQDNASHGALAIYLQVRPLRYRLPRSELD